MNQFKRAQVVILRSNSSKIWLSDISKNILLYSENIEQLKVGKSINPYHFYIVSDDEITYQNLKLVHWYYNTKENRLILFQGSMPKYHYSNLKEVISTTDNLQNGLISVKTTIPQPSQQFIAKYIESYNKGEVIMDILVEYEEKSNEDIQIDLCTFGHDEGLLVSERNEYLKTNSNDKLKINPKDNTITIKKLKDSWNRDEVSNLIKLFANNYQYASNDIGYDKWIKENL